MFITEGMHLRIPVGGLVVGPADASLTIEVALDMWPYWIDVALDHVVMADESRRRLMETLTAADEHGKGAALAEECKAGMVAIAACAFAIDAIYSAVVMRAPPPPDVVQSWNRNNTRRYARIHQTVQRSFRLTNAESRQMRQSFQQIFRFRDQSVHPSAAFTEPVLHPVLGVGVERRFVAHRLENAHAAANFTLAILRILVERPRQAHPELVEWCNGQAKSFIPIRVERWKATMGLGQPGAQHVVP